MDDRLLRIYKFLLQLKRLKIEDVPEPYKAEIEKEQNNDWYLPWNSWTCWKARRDYIKTKQNYKQNHKRTFRKRKYANRSFDQI